MRAHAATLLDVSGRSVHGCWCCGCCWFLIRRHGALPPIAQTLLTSCHSLAPSCPPAGYLSVAHYLVLNKAGGLRAKRAALESGFCPPDLAGELWLGWYVGVGVCNLLL